MYIQGETTISKLSLSNDGKNINIDMTINYSVEGADKMPNGSVGCTINLDLTSGERNTLVEELNTKTSLWFETNFNQ